MADRVLAFLGAATLCALSTASASAMDWGPFSLQLSDGITEQQAINAI
jgi:hypothetical protein